MKPVPRLEDPPQHKGGAHQATPADWPPRLRAGVAFAAAHPGRWCVILDGLTPGDAHGVAHRQRHRLADGYELVARSPGGVGTVYCRFTGSG